MRKRKGTVSTKSSSRAYPRGVLVVHGIGLQKPGITRDIFAKGIVSAVEDAGSTAIMATLDSVGGISRAEIDIADAPCVLLAEAYWADSIPDLRGVSFRRVGRQALALSRMFPYLLAGSLAPRVTEPDPMASSTNSVVTLRELRSWAPTLWRMATLYGTVIGLSVLIGLATARPWLAFLLAIIGVVSVVLVLTSDLLGQVRVAALEDAQIQPALARIRYALGHLEKQCDEVWIIAHSQGGYLAHRVLTEDKGNAHPRVRRFTGLASGLRPIRLGALARRGRWTAAGWLGLLGGVMSTLFVALMFQPGGGA